MTRRFYLFEACLAPVLGGARRAGLALAVLSFGLGASALPLRADPARILELLRIEPLFDLLQRESLIYGDDLATELLGGSEPGWRAEVAALHAPTRLMPPFRTEFAARLPTELQPAIEQFLSSELGQKMIGLELSAREAMLDQSVEEAAIERAAAADLAHDPRLAEVRALIAASDLVDSNVLSGLNANLAFYRAMAAGGGFPYEMSESEMTAEVAGQEPDIRTDITAWVEGYLFMACAPLTDAELSEAIAFFDSEPGRALIAAEFAGFDQVYEQASSDLGAALARRLKGQDL